LTEHELQLLCIEHLKARGVLYYHSGFRGIHRTGTSKNVKGWPDLFIFQAGGIPKFVELKAPGCKLKPDQITKIEDLVKDGYDCYVVDSIEKFKEAMKW
jgi:hypothetical protein